MNINQENNSFLRLIGFFLTSADFFGYPIHILSNRNEKYRSVYGGIISLVLIFFTLGVFISMLMIMITKSEYIAMTKEVHNIHPDFISLNKQNFSFAIQIQDGLSYLGYQNESIFNITMNQCFKSYQIENNKTETFYHCQTIPLEPCNLTKHIYQNQLKPYYIRMNLETLYCINFDSYNQSLKLEGQFDSDSWKWLNISISGCKNNSKNNIICAPDWLIKEKLKSGYVSLYIDDHITNLQDPNNEENIYGKNIFSAFSQLITKEINIYFKHEAYHIDNGYIFKDQQIINQLSYSYHYEQTEGPMREDFLRLRFSLDYKKKSKRNSNIYLIVHSVRFKKIQDILAVIGGLWKFLSIIGFLLVLPLNRIKFFIKVLNNSFLFDDFEKVNSNQNGEDEIILTILSKQIIQQQKYSQRKIEVIFRKYFRMIYKKVRLPILEYLKIIFLCYQCFRIRRQKLQIGIEKVEKILDINNIMMKLIEIEKLKILLLSPEQLHLFKFIEKPIIKQQEDSKRISISQKNYLQQFYQDSLFFSRKPKEEIQESIQAYLRILDENSSNQIDRTIIKNLDKRIQNIFLKQLDKIISNEQDKRNGFSINYEQYYQSYF